MKIIESIPEAREYVKDLKLRGQKVGFVPTMGALHKGHISLIELAKKHADEAIVSIYVNPKQFAPNEDFDEYPRTLEADLKKCRALGVAAVFVPNDAMMYGSESFLRIEVDELNKYMDGQSRVGFFEGIVQVVNKFFNIIEPDIAVFGQKDIQQFRILQQMVDEFNHDVELVMGSIIRADDGLALSSRNRYLDQEERKIAPSLFRGLRYVKKQIGAGAANINLLIDHQKTELKAKKMEIDYLNLFSFSNIKPEEEIKKDHKYILAGAVYLSETRLIDNMIIEL